MIPGDRFADPLDALPDRTDRRDAPMTRHHVPLTLALSALLAWPFGLLPGHAVAEEPPKAKADAKPEPAPGSGSESEIVEAKGSYESQGKTIAIERFEPKGSGKYPAVLVLHGSGGMAIGGPWFRDSARALARRGYVAHVVHYFDLSGTKLADLPTMKEHFPGWIMAVADGVSNVVKQPNVDRERVGLLGFSLGGYLSLSAAVFDPRVSAVVEYFGGLPEPLVKEVKSLPPTLILHGDADPIVPVTEARALEKLFKEKNVPYELQIYAGQGHGFFGETGRDALKRALAFFDKHVKHAPAPTRHEVARPNFDRLPARPRAGTGDEAPAGGK
jgi:carboxymethylenebutenolidase